MKRILISAVVLSVALGGAGVSSAGPATTKITGGGQTLVPAGGGAGDTVGFNAQMEDDGTVRGQFQYVKRNGTGAGQAQEVMHGEVTCAAVFTRPDGGGSGGMAAFGGQLRDGTPFRVDVTDNGSGPSGTDMILVRTGNEARGGDSELCDEGDADEGPALNRGNVTVHKTK